MFEFIRKHQRLVLSFLLVLILPSFVFFGIEGYSRMGDGENAAAKVGGYTITKEEWDNAQRGQLERMRQMFGNQFDAAMFDTPETKRAVLDNLIAQYALSAEATRAKLSVPTNVLQESIAKIPGLIKEDGTFDKEQYRTLLAAQGMTPEGFQSRLARDMAVQQLNGAVQLTGFTPKTVAAHLSDLTDQERTVQTLAFKASAFAGQVKVTDEQLKAYYDKNAKAFQIPESIKAEYVVLDAAAVQAQINVSEDDVKSYYDQNIQQYSSEEQRRASHILINVSPDASSADKDAAKAKAQALYAELQKNPAEFAKLAKENSQDPGSAKNGGDLGFFGKDWMVKPFEDAAQKLKKDEISPPVESEFGYHIIMLTDLKPAVAKPFAQVKDSIAADIKKQMMSKKFSELAEQFNNLVYEQGNSLKPAADKLKLKIETASNLMRQPNPALGDAAFNHPKFLAALFSNDAIKNKNNTEVVEVAPSTLIAGRIVEYKPLTTRPFEEVRNVVLARVMAEEEIALATKAGEAALAKLRAGEEVAGFSAAQTISRVKTQGWTEEPFNAVMKANVEKLPAFVGVEVPGQGYSIFRISKVEQPATVDAARRKTEQEQIANILAQQETMAYLSALKVKAKAEYLKAADQAPAKPEAF